MNTLPIVLLAVSELFTTDDQTRQYFRVSFGEKLIGRPTQRTLWASLDEDAVATWERPMFTREAALQHVGKVIPGVEICTSPCEPYSFEGRNGEDVEMNQIAFVRFSGEKHQAAANRRRKGVVLITGEYDEADVSAGNLTSAEASDETAVTGMPAE